MPIEASATPLVAVDAVALDLETTGLDVRRARIVQIGAVPLREGRARPEAALSLLVDPGEPIPAAATAVHGIADADVAGAAKTAQALALLRRFAGARLVIGHAVGYDLAVLRAEYGRLGDGWRPPRSLDTRLLAQIAAPALPDFGLDAVAGWLGLPPRPRHSAPSDALAAAEIFLALVPWLRERGIRTVAEAEAACRRLGPAAGPPPAAGWEAPAPPAQGEPALAGIDSYPYRHRVRDVMTAPPKLIDPAEPLAAAARRMAAEGVSSLFLPDEGGGGILTERDVLRAVAAEGEAALRRPLAAFASRPLATVPADAFVYRAIGRMDRLKVRHLGVRDEDGRLVGALSARDLLRLRAGAALHLGDAIDAAENVPALAAAWARLPAVAASLAAEAVAGRDIAGIVSRELGAATRRAAELAEAALAAEGLGPPPVPYAVLVLGSAGRGESLLALDQDNALVFAEGDPDGPEDRYFARLGALIADHLHAIAVPYCRGGVMARNPAWRGSLATWRRRIAQWIAAARPRDLLSVDIFFDLRPVHGDAGLAATLMQEAYERGGAAPEFVKLLAAAAPPAAPPLGPFGGLRGEDGFLDLKRHGLMPVVSAARVLAIRHRIARRSTAERLAALRDLAIGGAFDLDRIDAAHRLFLARILTQQISDIREGIPASNRVRLAALSRPQREELKEALRALSPLADLVRDLLF